MRIGVVGTGHVGLVTSATLAEIGHDVVATDRDGEKISSLEKGRVPFFEPGLQELVEKNVDAGRLSFTSEPAPAAIGAEVLFICVGTPPRSTGEASMALVERAVTGLAPHLERQVVIVEKSTVPAGTSRRLRRVLRHARPDLGTDLEVVSNPEFLREGTAIEDSLRPDRILVGADSEWAMEKMRSLYKPLIDKGHILIEADVATAELSKHACNAFLAMKISYANALARLCEQASADVQTVVEVMGTDPRIGRHFLNAGIGYGGFCFPKDVAAFERLSSRMGYEFPLLGEIARINDEALDAAVRKIGDALWNLDDKRIAVLGLSFKPGTDDVRLSPSLALAQKLIDEGARVVGYDPVASDAAKREVPQIEIAPDVYNAITGSDCLVLATEWPEFADLDFVKVKEVMAFPVVIDGRNFFDADKVVSAGLLYYPVGRPAVLPPSLGES